MAIRSFARSFPTLKREMEADGASAEVVYTRGADEGGNTATKGGASECSRVAAKVSDFPALTARSFVALDGEPHIITSLKKVGCAMWLIGISESLSKAPVVFRRSASVGGDGREIGFTIPALVSRGYDGVSESAPYNHPRQEVYFVVVRDVDWSADRPPEFGDRIETVEYGAMNAQQVTHGRGHWTIVCTRDERREVD